MGRFTINMAHCMHTYCLLLQKRQVFIILKIPSKERKKIALKLNTMQTDTILLISPKKFNDFKKKIVLC